MQRERKAGKGESGSRKGQIHQGDHFEDAPTGNKEMETAALKACVTAIHEVNRRQNKIKKPTK